MIYVKIYPTLPEEACWLRETVFVDEQGFTDFYETIGYTQYGEIEDDQGCPHIWMKKEL